MHSIRCYIYNGDVVYMRTYLAVAMPSCRDLSERIMTRSTITRITTFTCNVAIALIYTCILIHAYEFHIDI